MDRASGWMARPRRRTRSGASAAVSIRMSPPMMPEESAAARNEITAELKLPTTRQADLIEERAPRHQPAARLADVDLPGPGPGAGGPDRRRAAGPADRL